MARRISLAAALAVGLLLVCAGARAVPGEAPGLASKRVLLVRPEHGGATLDEAFNRLRAELELNDFEVTTIDEGSDANASRSITESAERAGAFAGIGWARHDDATEAVVWIAGRAGGAPTSRDFDLGSSREAPNVLAVRVVDLLRSSLHDAAPKEPLPPRMGSETRPIPALPPPRDDVPPPWQLSAEVLQIGAGSSVGAAYGPSLGFSRRIDRFRVGVVVSGPLLGASWSASEGSASVWQALVMAEGSFSIWRNRTFEWTALAGAGAYHLSAHGEPNPSLIARTSAVDSALASAGTRGEFRLTQAASVVAAARLLVLTPRPGVAVDREYTTLSMPLAVVSVGAAVGF